MQMGPQCDVGGGGGQNGCDGGDVDGGGDQYGNDGQG